MNISNAKKLLLIVVIAGAVFAIVSWQMKKQETSPTSNNQPSAGKTVNKQTPPFLAPTAEPATKPILNATAPTIDPMYQNKIIPPQVSTFYSKYRIVLLAPLTSLVIITPGTLISPVVLSADGKSITQKSWSDNLFKYFSIAQPTGVYTAELTSAFQFNAQFACSTKGLVATCIINSTDLKITPK